MSETSGGIAMASTEGLHHDLLRDPIIALRGADDTVRRHALPGVLAALAGGDLFGDFPALQAHQSHPWYAFLVQLGALAMHGAGEGRPPTDPEAWAEWLLALTDGDRAPWCLVVDDPARPALLQAAAPDLAAFKSTIGHPDELDILVTSKNHDVKALRVAHPRPEHWLFALVALQTMQGYPGRGYYGIARMNGGMGNRPAVGHQPSIGWGARFRRDVVALVERRDDIVDGYGYADEGGHALLWCVPWDRESSLTLPELDPLFVEVCQAVRLVRGADGIEGRKTTQGAARVDAKALNGRTGDPWTPIDVAGEKSLTLSGGGFDYAKLVDLMLSGNYQHGALGERAEGDPEALWFAGWALVRGQGKTEGLHTRRVAVPGEMQWRFEAADAREALAKAAQRRVELAGEMKRKVLAPALGRLRGTDKDSKSEVIGRFTDQCLARFEGAVDDVFFEALWRDAASEGGAGDEGPWRAQLVGLAGAILEDAVDRAPLPSARRYKAIAAAESRFRWGARAFRGEAGPMAPDAEQDPSEEAADV